MTRLDGPAQFILVFGLGLVVGLYLAGQPVGEQLRAAAASGNQGAAPTTGKPVPSRQTIGESAGSGDGWTDVFPLRDGIAHITVRYSGSGPLHFGLVDEHGSSLWTADGAEAVVGGQFSGWKAGAKATIQSPGRYRFRIRSDGDWKITVAQ